VDQSGGCADCKVSFFSFRSAVSAARACIKKKSMPMQNLCIRLLYLLLPPAYLERIDS
jgi:hypothetical protein